MKKYLLTAVICLLIQSSVKAQLDPLPNAGFENWFTNSEGQEVPDGDLNWKYHDYGFLTYPQISKSTDAYEGTYAI